MKKINIFNLFLLNIIIFGVIYIIHLKSINNYRILSQKCNYFIELHTEEIEPDLFVNLDFQNIGFYLERSRHVFMHDVKKKYNIQNSDTGLLIIKNNDLECQKVIENIKDDIKNQNIAKILEKNLKENVNLYYSEKFLPFKKSFKLKIEDWNLIIAYFKLKKEPLIKIESIKKMQIFNSIDFKVLPSILIFFFSNFIGLIFLFFRDKIKNII